MPPVRHKLPPYRDLYADLYSFLLHAGPTGCTSADVRAWATATNRSTTAVLHALNVILVERMGVVTREAHGPRGRHNQNRYTVVYTLDDIQ